MELNEIKCSVCPKKVDKAKLAAVKERICDVYCRYPGRTSMTQEELEKICDKCPLTELTS